MIKFEFTSEELAQLIKGLESRYDSLYDCSEHEEASKCSDLIDKLESYWKKDKS